MPFKCLVEFNHNKHVIVMDDNRCANGVTFDTVLDAIDRQILLQIGDKISRQTHVFEVFDTDFNEYVVVSDNDFVQHLSRFRIQRKPHYLNVDLCDEDIHTEHTIIDNNSNSLVGELCCDLSESLSMCESTANSCHNERRSDEMWSNGFDLVAIDLVRVMGDIEVDTKMINSGDALSGKHLLKYWKRVAYHLNSYYSCDNYTADYCAQMFDQLMSKLYTVEDSFASIDRVLLVDNLVKLPLNLFSTETIVYKKLSELKVVRNGAPLIEDSDTNDDHYERLLSQIAIQQPFLKSHKDIKRFTIMLEVVEKVAKNHTFVSGEVWKSEVYDRMKNRGHNAANNTKWRDKFNHFLQFYKKLLMYAPDSETASNLFPLFKKFHSLDLTSLNKNYQYVNDLRKKFDSKESQAQSYSFAI